MSDDRAIAAECQAAQAAGREISDGCARAIAAQYISPDGPAGVAFATSGAIADPDVWNVWTDLFHFRGRSMYPHMTKAEKLAADMLGTYLIDAGERGPVPGWSGLWVR